MSSKYWLWWRGSHSITCPSCETEHSLVGASVQPINNADSKRVVVPQLAHMRSTGQAGAIVMLMCLQCL